MARRSNRIWLAKKPEQFGVVKKPKRAAIELPQIMRRQELADALKVNIAKIDRLIDAGQLVAKKSGRAVLILNAGDYLNNLPDVA
jgi:hypothetical protein